MLKFFGVVFLVIIGLLLAFFAWLFFKVRSGVHRQARISAIEEGMDTPPIVLERTETPSFAQPEPVAELVDQAVRLGATSCGDYDVPAVGTRLCAHRLEMPPVYVVIYDHDEVGPWTDVVLRLDEDRSFTASTVPEIARGAPRHPDDEIMYFAPGTAIGVLVQAATERTNENTTLPATPEAFKAFFEDAAEKSRKYIHTQAVSQEWLSSIAEDAGVELAGDEAAQINCAREAQQAMETERDCIRSLAESGNLTAAQWDDLRDNLVVVWDDMPGEYVPSVFYNHVDVPEELEPVIDALEERHDFVRARVAQLNSTLPEDKRLVLVGTVSSPVQADIYRNQIPPI
jgi:hypothetical protein